jgi:hypothetical protein
MKIHLVGVLVLHADGQMDGHDKDSSHQSLWKGT